MEESPLRVVLGQSCAGPAMFCKSAVHGIDYERYYRGRFECKRPIADFFYSVNANTRRDRTDPEFAGEAYVLLNSAASAIAGGSITEE